VDLVCGFLEEWAVCVRTSDKPATALKQTALTAGVTVELANRDWVRVLRFPNDQRIVVKWRAPELRHEASHLEWLSKQWATGAPRFVWGRKERGPGAVEHHLFAMEHIEGVPLHRAVRCEPGRMRELLTLSIGRLAAIHTLIEICVAGELDLRGPYWKEALRDRLSCDFGRVLQRAPACERHVGDVKTDRIARELSCQTHRVLGHGDYKGNNLMVVDVSGRPGIRPIDWVDMGKAAPWYDLAHLLHVFRRVPGGVDLTREAVEAYLQQVQGEGCVCGVQADEALRMLEYGEMARLITSTASHVCGSDDDSFFVGRSAQLGAVWRRCCES